MDIPTKIILASRNLINSQGLVNWTVDELAKEADVSKRTIYRYFSSKDEIIEATLDKFMLEMQAKLKIILTEQSSPVQILTTIMSELFINGRFIFSKQGLEDLKYSYPQLWQKIDDFRSARIRQVIQHFRTLEGLPSLQTIDDKILTTAFIATIQSVLNPTFLLENNMEFEEAAGHLSKLFFKILT